MSIEKLKLFFQCLFQTLRTNLVINNHKTSELVRREQGSPLLPRASKQQREKDELAAAVETRNGSSSICTLFVFVW